MFGSFPPSPLVGLRLQSLLAPGSRHCYGIISLIIDVAPLLVIVATQPACIRKLPIPNAIRGDQEVQSSRAPSERFCAGFLTSIRRRCVGIRYSPVCTTRWVVCKPELRRNSVPWSHIRIAPMSSQQPLIRHRLTGDTSDIVLMGNAGR